jgi:hypothetical protein
MSGLLALAIIGQVASAAKPENPAITAFREACVEGSFHLTPERGKIVSEREYGNPTDILAGAESIANRTIIKLADAPNSHLLITEYQHLKQGSIARTCLLVSKAVPKTEGMAAFLQGLPDKNIASGFNSFLGLPVWTANHPELGYLKLFSFAHDTAILEVGMYPAASEQLISGTSKQ